MCISRGLRLILLMVLAVLVSAPISAQLPDNPVPGGEFGGVLSPIEQQQKDRRVLELRRRMQRNISLKRWSVAIDEMKELVLLDPYSSK